MLEDGVDVLPMFIGRSARSHGAMQRLGEPSHHLGFARRCPAVRNPISKDFGSGAQLAIFELMQGRENVPWFGYAYYPIRV